MSTSWLVVVPKPALFVHPPGAVSLDEAHQAVELWEHYSGKVLDGAQRQAVEVMMGETVDGRWAARSTGRAEPRQNGKGDELEVVEFWGLVQRGEWIVHTAHEFPTAKSAHQRMVGLLEGHRDLRRLVGKVRYGNSDRVVEMRSGAIIVYRTRTRGGGRGLDDISRIVVDEAQHAQPEQLASVTPILAANPNPQTNFVGTGGIEGVSDWWWSIRLRALSGDPGDFGYLEHSAERVSLNRDGQVVSEVLDVSDRGLWGEANPALGSRIEIEFLEEQLRILGEGLFAREHLCVWDEYPNDEGGFLPFGDWLRLEVGPPDNQSSVSYGLAADGGQAFVASASRLANGDLYVDLLPFEVGTDWVVDDVVDRWRRKKLGVRVGVGGEGAFVRPLRENGVKVVEVTARQFQQSCAEILDTLKNGTIRHLKSPELDRAVASARRRDVGKDGAWVWAESQVDVTPLRAVTLAVSGVAQRRRPRVHTMSEV